MKPLLVFSGTLAKQLSSDKGTPTLYICEECACCNTTNACNIPSERRIQTPSLPGNFSKPSEASRARSVFACNPGMRDMLHFLIARDTMHQQQWLAVIEELGGR
jgi:hypothetical protein